MATLTIYTSKHAPGSYSNGELNWYGTMVHEFYLLYNISRSFLVHIRDLTTGIRLLSQWVDQSTPKNNELVACKLQHDEDRPVSVTCSVMVKSDLAWCVHIHGQHQIKGSVMP